MATYRVYIKQVEYFAVDVEAGSREEALALTADYDLDEFEATGEVVIEDDGVDVYNDLGDLHPARH